MANIDLFENVAVPLPSTLYWAVKVVFPGVSPLTTNDASGLLQVVAEENQRARIRGSLRVCSAQSE